MSDFEDDDKLTEMVPSIEPNDFISTKKIQQILLQEKQKNPSKFVSHWEMDEEDIDEATEEERLNNPVVRTLWAAETGNTDVLMEMLQTDSSLVYAVDSDGYTPLHRASYEGHMQAVTILLDNGANIDAKTSDGWTALHSATYWGQTEIVSYLIRRGACVNAQTNGQQTPLHIAAAAPNGGSRDVLQLLLMNDMTDVGARNQLGETARVIAERSSQHHKLFSITDEAINVLQIRTKTSPSH